MSLDEAWVRFNLWLDRLMGYSDDTWKDWKEDGETVEDWKEKNEYDDIYEDLKEK